jgi:hypothetical protein
MDAVIKPMSNWASASFASVAYGRNATPAWWPWTPATCLPPNTTRGAQAGFHGVMSSVHPHLCAHPGSVKWSKGKPSTARPEPNGSLTMRVSNFIERAGLMRKSASAVGKLPCPALGPSAYCVVFIGSRLKGWKTHRWKQRFTKQVKKEYAS